MKYGIEILDMKRDVRDVGVLSAPLIAVFSSNYISLSDAIKVSQACEDAFKFFQPTLEQKFMQAVCADNRDYVNKFCNEPDFCPLKKSPNEYSALKIALAKKNFKMTRRLLSYVNIEENRDKILAQYREVLDEKQEENLGYFEILEEITAKIINSSNNEECGEELQKLKDYLPLDAGLEIHFNYNILLKAYELYNRHGGDLGWVHDRRAKLFALAVIGYLQHCLPEHDIKALLNSAPSFLNRTPPFCDEIRTLFDEDGITSDGGLFPINAGKRYRDHLNSRNEIFVSEEKFIDFLNNLQKAKQKPHMLQSMR